MKKNHRLSRAFCLVLAALTVLSVAAAATAGSAEDPLVTLSYLKEKFLPEILTQVEEKLAEREESLGAALDEQVKEDIAALEEEYGSGSAGGEGESADIVDSFVVVTLSRDQVLMGDIGCEIMLRVGSAKCVAPTSPGLIDTTAATTINDSAALVKNHLYMITIEERGIKAASDTVKVLVRGAYAVQ